MNIDGRTENESLSVGMFPDMEADAGMFRLNRLDLGRGWTFWVLMVYYETMKSISGMATVRMPKKRPFRTWSFRLPNHKVQNDHFGQGWNNHQHQHYLPLHCLFPLPESRMHSFFMDSIHSWCVHKNQDTRTSCKANLSVQNVSFSASFKIKTTVRRHPLTNY